jgi:uncharacterized repeat protein (TIGR03803 family)
VFYGTTYYGGAFDYGSVFRIGPDGFTTLHSFSHLTGDTGSNPEAGLTRGRDGNLYGITAWGRGSVGGIIFSLDPSTGEVRPLYKLLGTPYLQGSNAQSAPIAASDGFLYGTTQWGGQLSGGVIYRLALTASSTPTSLDNVAASASALAVRRGSQPA